MQTSSAQGRIHGSFLSEIDISKIQLFCKIAQTKNSSVHLSEILSLASIDMTEEELVNAWTKSEALSNQYEITSGLVIEKKNQTGEGEEERIPLDLQRNREERISRAKSNISYAKKFLSLLREDDFKIIAISGSTSYYSASKNDDLDFFLITEKDSMWSSFVKSLILARVFKLFDKNAPYICLSYVADEKFLEEQFASNHDALTARDAISAMVIRGDQYYVGLLKESKWIASYFPKLYESRISAYHEADTNFEIRRNRGFIVAKKISNAFLYYTAGSYIRLKSNLLNRKLMKQGRTNSIFELRIGKDHCIYESASYLKLRKMYSEIQKTETNTKSKIPST